MLCLLKGENKIKQMNGTAYNGLNKLRYVWFYENICNSKINLNATEIANSLEE